MRRHRHRISTHLITGVVAICLWTSSAAFTVGAHQRAADNVQIAKDSHSRKLADTDNESDFGLDTPASHSAGPRLGRGAKSASGGYDPQRIKRFWKHYHGDTRRERKQKPLEHER